MAVFIPDVCAIISNCNGEKTVSKSVKDAAKKLKRQSFSFVFFLVHWVYRSYFDRLPL